MSGKLASESLQCKNKIKSDKQNFPNKQEAGSRIQYFFAIMKIVCNFEEFIVSGFFLHHFKGILCYY